MKFDVHTGSRAGAVVREREDERRRLQRGELPEVVLRREHDPGHEGHAATRPSGSVQSSLLDGAPPHLCANPSLSRVLPKRLTSHRWRHATTI